MCKPTNIKKAITRFKRLKRLYPDALALRYAAKELNVSQYELAKQVGYV